MPILLNQGVERDKAPAASRLFAPSLYFHVVMNAEEALAYVRQQSPYNEWTAERAERLIQGILAIPRLARHRDDIEFVVGREGSPVFYVTIRHFGIEELRQPGKVWLDLMQELLQLGKDAQADENWESKNPFHPAYFTWRFWWD